MTEGRRTKISLISHIYNLFTLSDHLKNRDRAFVEWLIELLSHITVVSF